jgi:hypothetical protein
MKKLLALAALTAVSTAPSFAQTIATWTFETTSASITGSATSLTGIAADVGTGTASQVHGSAATYSSPAGNGSTHSLSSTTWAVGDYTQFQFSTTGFHGLSLSFDQTSSNTGPGHYNLSYSLDGGANFTSVGGYTVLANAAPNPTWSAGTPQSIFNESFNLGSAIDDTTSVLVRLSDADTVSANGGTEAATGTDRIDNFSVFTTPVPEPSTMALGIVGGLAGLVAWKRRK